MYNVDFNRTETLGAATNDGGSGGRGAQQSPTHQVAGPGEAILRTFVEGCTDNRQRGAGILALARTPEDDQHQELHTIIGLKPILAGGKGHTYSASVLFHDMGEEVTLVLL